MVKLRLLFAFNVFVVSIKRTRDSSRSTATTVAPSEAAWKAKYPMPAVASTTNNDGDVESFFFNRLRSGQDFVNVGEVVCASCEKGSRNGSSVHNRKDGVVTV